MGGYFVDELIEGAKDGDLERVKKALKSGEDPNKYNGAALTKAVFYGHLQI